MVACLSLLLLPRCVPVDSTYFIEFSQSEVLAFLFYTPDLTQKAQAACPRCPSWLEAAAGLTCI